MIDFLAEHHWLPSYAFPQDVVKLTVRHAEESDRMRMERDRERGISEYAPGSEIIADGKLFESVGIDLERREPELQWFSTDSSTRQIRIAHTGDDSRIRGNSGNRSSRPIRFIEPRGFTTMWDADVREPNLFRLRPPSNSEVFLLDGANQFEECVDLPGVQTGILKDGRLFRANLAKRNRGFMLCLRCGLGLDSGRHPGSEHITPWGSRCRGRFEQIALAHVFSTDVMQIRFPGFSTPLIGNSEFWMTLTTGLINSACEILSIDRGDLDATYRSHSEDDPKGEIVIYDKVPGGAGHVQRIRQNLRTVFHATLERLRSCSNPECDIQSSCYACLRSHRNQFCWASLRRTVPIPWLTGLCQAR